MAEVPELAAGKEAEQYFADTAVGFEITLGEPPNQVRGRIVGNEILAELEAQMMGGRRALRQNVERLLAFLDTAAVDRAPEPDLIGKIVAGRIEEKPLARAHRAHRGEAPLAPGKVGSRRVLASYDAPSGQDMRERRDVGLGVAAVDPQRVQLHQLARVIFVDSFEATARAGSVRRRVLPVVEIEQHRRMPGSGTQQIAKAAEDMGANRVLFECADPQIIEALIGKNVEVIEPEGDHHLAQLPRFEYRPINPRRHRLLNHDARGPARGFDYRRIRL